MDANGVDPRSGARRDRILLRDGPSESSCNELPGANGSDSSDLGSDFDEFDEFEKFDESDESDLDPWPRRPIAKATPGRRVGRLMSRPERIRPSQGAPGAEHPIPSGDDLPPHHAAPDAGPTAAPEPAPGSAATPPAPEVRPAPAAPAYQPLRREAILRADAQTRSTESPRSESPRSATPRSATRADEASAPKHAVTPADSVPDTRSNARPELERPAAERHAGEQPRDQRSSDKPPARIKSGARPPTGTAMDRIAADPAKKLSDSDRVVKLSARAQGPAVPRPAAQRLDDEGLVEQARAVRTRRAEDRRSGRRRKVLLSLIGTAVTAGLVWALIAHGNLAELNDTRPTPVAAASPEPSAAASSTPTPSATPTPTPTAKPKAITMYGTPRSGLPWHSGFWAGGTMSGSRVNAAGTWRGRPMDFATVYPAYADWGEIYDSDWAVTNYAGFKGRLSYGLPLLPKNRKGKWEDVTSGKYDYVFRHIAQVLVQTDHGDAAIRMGVEANGYWFPWAVTAENADEFKAAYKRIRTVMRKVSPDFTFWLDLNFGTSVGGSNDRMAPLTVLYPGDDVVDGISMDHYNRSRLPATDDVSWALALSPTWAAGLQDAVDFARAHNKGFAVPEWGLDAKLGPGDSPFFMQKMHEFFTENADVLVYENYFSEPDTYIQSSLFSPDQNPKASAMYRKLWGK